MFEPDETTNQLAWTVTGNVRRNPVRILPWLPTLAIAFVVLFAFVSPSHAQYNIGLYKNGKLITTFGAISPATNAA